MVLYILPASYVESISIDKLVNERKIGYFHKFESHKNNAVWHVISSIFFIGAVCAGIISIMWWNEN